MAFAWDQLPDVAALNGGADEAPDVPAPLPVPTSPRRRRALPMPLPAEDDAGGDGFPPSDVWHNLDAADQEAVKLGISKWEPGAGLIPADAPAPADKRRMPWDRPDELPEPVVAALTPRRPAPAVPRPEAPDPLNPFPAPKPEEHEGLLSKIGYALDTPGAYLRGVLAGQPGERVSGQQMLENWGLFDKSDEPAPFLSGKGLAGFGAEIVADPLNLLPGFLGLKAETAAGRAAAKLAPHLDEAQKAVRAWEGVQKAVKAGPTIIRDLLQGERMVPAVAPGVIEAAHAALEHPIFGRLVDDAGKAVPEEELVRRAAETGTPLGQAAREVLANPEGAVTRVAEDAAERVRQGHESTFSVGGAYHPLPIPFIGDRLKVNLPQADLLRLPEVNALLQKAGGVVQALPGIKQIGQLVRGTPEEEAAKQARRSAEGAQDLRVASIERQRDLAQQVNRLPPGSPEQLAAQQELEALVKETTPRPPATAMPPDVAALHADEPFWNEALNEPHAAAEVRPKGLVDPETGDVVQVPGPRHDVLDPHTGEPIPDAQGELIYPGANNPEYIKEQFGNERARLMKPIQEAAQGTEERILAEAERKAQALDRGDLEGAVYRPKPGQIVEFSPQDVIGDTAGRRRNDIRGRVVGANSDGTFTVQESGGAQHIVPQGAVKRVARNVQRDVDALDAALLPPEIRGRVMQRSADTREALRASTELPPEAYINPRGMNIEAKKARVRDMQGWGVQDMGHVGQAQALPKALEKLLGLPQIEEHGAAALPGFKSVEFVSADAAELVPGDKLRLGGDVFTVQPAETPGRVKLKDGFPIEVPESLVPKDKGVPIQRAGAGVPGIPGASEEPAARIGKRAGRMTDQELQNVLGNAENRSLPPEVQAHLGALNQEVQEAGRGQAGLDPFKAFELEKDLPPDVQALAAQEAGRVRAEARGRVTAMRPEAPTPEIQAQLGDLFEREAKALRATEGRPTLDEAMRTAPPAPPRKGIAAGVKAVGVDRGRIQELVDQGKTLAEAQRIAAGEGVLQGVRAGPAGAVQAAQAEVRAAGVKNPGAVIPKGMDPNAAAKTAELMKQLAGFTPEEGREFLGYAERTAKGAVPEKYAQAVEAWHAHHDALSEFERQVAGATKLSSEGGLGYALHLSAPEAKETFQEVYKDPALAAQLHEVLNQKRAAKGLPPIDFRAGAAPTDAARLAQMDPEVRKMLEKVGLSNEYLARTFNPSMVERAYKGLGVSEINDAFRQIGMQPVFSENPQRLLYARQMRHVQVRAQADFVGELVKGGAGFEIGAVERGAPVRGMPGIEAVESEGRRVFTVPEINASRPAAMVGFDSPELAQAAAKTYRKMTNPEEVSPVLAWYDGITRLYKSYLTRMFPAFHVRNHIGNRLQALMFEDVPTTGEHYRIGQQLVAGKDFQVTLGDGRTLNRQQLINEGVKAGMGTGGFYEDLLDQVGRPQSKGSFNPLDPNNRAIQAGERVSAALAQAPGALLSGTPELLKNATGEGLENADRWGAYTYFVQQGFSPKAAVEKVNRALFDYSGKNLSDFERNFARRMVFFYGYVRNVIPRVLETALTDTRKLVPYAHLAQTPGKPNPMPAWAGEGIAVPLGKDDEGKPMVLAGLDTPVEAAFEPFEGFTGGLGRGLAKLGAHLNPLLKVPIELATNKDLYLDKDISDLRKAPHWAEELPPEVQAALGAHAIQNKNGTTRYEMDPYALYALRNSPVSRISNTASRAADDAKGGGEVLANLLTGSRIVSVDTAREAELQKRDAAIEQLKELERQGLVSGYKAPERFSLTDTGKGAAELPEIQALLDATKPAKKAPAQGAKGKTHRNAPARPSGAANLPEVQAVFDAGGGSDGELEAAYRAGMARLHREAQQKKNASRSAPAALPPEVAALLGR
ncbi:MAG: hypothetical protein HY291_02205 [Planctomycetes bacterium]|nr:hypothetical protein [Planctomycetota bacterium]